jgi:Domain of unknown function (DUF4824)
LRRRVLLLSAAGVVLLANLLALLHAARNRMGTPEAELTLTARELTYYSSATVNDDSGVSLHLRWTDPGGFQPWAGYSAARHTWLDREALGRLGFACALDPDSPSAQRYYERQRPRVAYVALEYNGPAWRNWFDEYQRSLAEAKQKGLARYLADDGSSNSHLVAVDADSDPRRLRERHPDRKSVVVIPAVIGVLFEARTQDSTAEAPRPARVYGCVRESGSAIHVPLPFSSAFRSFGRDEPAKDRAYQVNIRYGSQLEPYIINVTVGPG